MFTKADMIEMAQLRRAVQMFAAQLPEAQALEVSTIYPRYQPGTTYPAGQYITDEADANGDPRLYKVLQSHKSQKDWPPELTPSLYERIGLDAEGWPIWTQPSGIHDAYNTGDIASRNNQLWISNIDGNTTEPGTDDRWWSRYEEV